ncbi:MAG: glycine cleavage system aminomethyltransferase GcvT [Gammaproteobacteria bacterium]
MSAIAQTPLHDLHAEWGGKMTAFAGYHLPISYAGGGFIAEHLHTRAGASLFDVSHMGQVLFSGAEAAAALEKLTPGGVSSLAPGCARYMVLTNEKGGVLDDFIAANDGERGIFIVFNASRKREDLAHVRAHLPASCAVSELADWGLIALQGPQAEAAAASVVPEIARLNFMESMWFEFGGSECRAARGGYTGEDGFEFSLPAARTEEFARRLAAHAAVKPAGLGARDSLRLEAGLCLYGNELTEETTPVEAGLTWTIPKARRAGGDYLGSEIIARQIQDGAPRRLIGLRVAGKKVARAGAPLQNAAGETIGAVTSGVHAPSLQAAVAMGYVRADCAAEGTIIAAQVRGEAAECKIARPPFVPHQYKKGTKP